MSKGSTLPPLWFSPCLSHRRAPCEHSLSTTSVDAHLEDLWTEKKRFASAMKHCNPFRQPEGRGSEQLTKYLDTMARFHQYSFLQLHADLRPKARCLECRRLWEMEGVQSIRSKRGEGIAILAPLVRKKKDESGSNATDSSKSSSDEKVLFGGFGLCMSLTSLKPKVRIFLNSLP